MTGMPNGLRPIIGMQILIPTRTIVAIRTPSEMPTGMVSGLPMVNDIWTLKPTLIGMWTGLWIGMCTDLCPHV